MPDPWNAERTLLPAEAASLIDAAFPDLRPVTATAFGSGWDNTAILVNDDIVFRFPRRAVALPFFDAENRVLGSLAPRLPLTVPTPIYQGLPTDAFPWPFAGYRLIAGRTACAAGLDDEQRTQMAGPLGRFLAVLHAISDDEAAALGVGPDTIRRLDWDFRAPYLRRDLAWAAERGYVREPERWEPIIEEGRLRSDLRTLVHGDLYVRHLVVGEQGDLVGIIDWGDVHRGNPAIDLAIAHSYLPPAGHATFRAEYGPIDDATWAVARFRALFHTTMLLRFADDTNDRDLLRECATTFRYLGAPPGV